MAIEIEEAVKEKYGAVAASGLSTDQAGVQAVAEAFGYSAEELRSIPAEANMGLSCGNPTATANLDRARSWLTWARGGGLDVFLAAKKVGPDGQGHRHRHDRRDARPGAEERRRRPGPQNVEFHMATIDKLPLPDASADCIISNCVINLAPDKPAVFREIARVLKPGGRRRGLGHRPQEAAPARDRAGPARLRRLHRRGHPDRRVPRGPQGSGLRPRRSHRLRGRPERLRPD